MANYSVLKAAVQAVVKTNGNQEITGANMQSTLISIINSLGTGYQFMGVATPSTSPGTPDYNVAYIGGAGTYANFGTSVTVPVGSIGVFKYNGSWTKEQIALFAGIDDVPTANSNNLVKSGAVYDELLDIFENSTGYNNLHFENISGWTNFIVVSLKTGDTLTANFVISQEAVVKYVGFGTQSSPNDLVQKVISAGSTTASVSYTATEEIDVYVNSYGSIATVDIELVKNGQTIYGILQDNITRLNGITENLNTEINGVNYFEEGTATANLLKIPCNFLVAGRNVVVCLTECSVTPINVRVYTYTADNQYAAIGIINELNTEYTVTIPDNTRVSIGFYVISGQTANMSGYVRYSDTEVGLQSRVTELEENSEAIEGRIKEIELETEGIKTANVENLLQNGDFHNGLSSWIPAKCSASVSDGVATLVGNGSSESFSLEYYMPINIEGYSYMFSIMFKIEDDCEYVRAICAGGWQDTKVIPEKNKWYQVIVKYDGNKTGTTNAIGAIQIVFADANTQNGATVKVKGAVAFETGSDFGIGENPMMWKLVKMMSYNTPWIGTKEVIVWKDEPKEQSRIVTSYASRRRPVVTIVDDDGYQAVYDKYVKLSQVYGVPFVSAVSIGSTINDWDALELVNTYGWEIAAHPSAGNGGLASLETEEEIEEYMVNTNEDLARRGFPFDNIVYADGEPDERVRRIAKKYYDCGVVGSHPMLNYGVIANFEIQRYPLGYGAPSTWNIDTYKGFIDEAINKNGWLIIMTHCSMPEHDQNIQSILEQIIQYCQTNEIEIMTLRDGFNIFGNPLECGDFTGKEMQDSEGLAINKDGQVSSKNLLSKGSLENLLATLSSALGGVITATYNENTQEYDFQFTTNNDN